MNEKSLYYNGGDLIAAFAWGMNKMGFRVMNENWYRMYERSMTSLAVSHGFLVNCYYSISDDSVLVSGADGIMRWAENRTMDDVYRKLAAMPLVMMMVLIEPFQEYGDVDYEKFKEKC